MAKYNLERFIETYSEYEDLKHRFFVKRIAYLREVAIAVVSKSLGVTSYSIRNGYEPSFFLGDYQALVFGYPSFVRATETHFILYNRQLRDKGDSGEIKLPIELLKYSDRAIAKLMRELVKTYKKHYKLHLAPKMEKLQKLEKANEELTIEQGRIRREIANARREIEIMKTPPSELKRHQQLCACYSSSTVKKPPA